MKAERDQGEAKDQQKRIKRNASQIGLYLEQSFALGMAGAIPDVPRSHKEKGLSRTPASQAYEDFALANHDASRLIDWRVSILRSSGTGYGGVRFAGLLSRLSGDPGAVSHWQNDVAGMSADEKKGSEYSAWLKLCRLVADSIAVDHPYLDLVVVVSPHSKPAATPKAAGYESRKVEVRYTYREIAARVEEIKAAHQGIPKEEAKQRAAKEFDCSLGKVKDALAFIKREDPEDPDRLWWEAKRRGRLAT